MNRRELIGWSGLALGSVAASADDRTAKPATAQAPVEKPPSNDAEQLPSSGLYLGGWSSLLHVWTDAQGVSHAEHLVISKDVKPVAVTQMFIRPEAHGFVDWHNPRVPAFVITIEGDLEVEVTDGTHLALPPSRLAFLEDSTGKGHITRTRDVVNLFVATPPGFDIRRWVKGEVSPA